MFLAFHRAGPGDYRESAGANAQIAHLHNSVLRVKTAAGRFVGLGYAANIPHNINGQDFFHINMGGVAHQAQDGGVGALAEMDGKILRLKIFNQLLHLRLFNVVFQNYNHTTILPY